MGNGLCISQAYEAAAQSNCSAEAVASLVTIAKSGTEEHNAMSKLNMLEQFDIICRYCVYCFNPYLTKRFSHHYQLDEFTFILVVLGVIFIFLSDFSMKFLCANRIASDGTPRSAASHLGLFCLPVSHKRDARLK